MPEGDEKERFNIFSILIVGLFVITALSNFYFFYFQKDYDFIVETACDPTKEKCFERDCSNPDDCPPNELSNFKRYVLKANDFQYCENEDCENACGSGTIKCEQVGCSEDEYLGEYCVSPDGASTDEEVNNEDTGLDVGTE